MKRRSKLKHAKSGRQTGQSVQSDYRAIKELVYSLFFLGSLVFLAIAVAQEVFDLFPSIKVSGMVVLAVGFVMLVGGGAWLSGRIEKRTGMAEDKAQYLSIFLLVGGVALVLGLFWKQLSPLLSSLFH